MIEYRHFRNIDPPDIVSLWHLAGLGRGAAEGFGHDEFERIVFAQPYFDRHGLLLAFDEQRLVGFCHAGFAPNANRTALDFSRGTISALIVHPEYRRRGIGTELRHRGEQYLRERGAVTAYAGSGDPEDPLYAGLYGGGMSAGILASDPAGEPFFTNCGYVADRRFTIFHRDLRVKGDPVGLRLLGMRRSTRLQLAEDEAPTWWWTTRRDRVDPDAGRMALVAKNTSAIQATGTVLSLHAFILKWRVRAIAVCDLSVAPGLEGKGFLEAMLVEIGRRLRGELIDLIEVLAESTDAPRIAEIEGAGFVSVDTGTVYKKSLAD